MLINIIPRKNYYTKRNLGREIIAIDISTLELSLDKKHFYVEIKTKLFNLFNRKKLMKIFYQQNQKMIIVLLK